MKNLAIITARAGSKGLPNKNILPLAGKPLMAWAIEAALKSGIYDKVMVSTDSEEYAEIAREWGAEVPFLRSAATSGDMASSWDVCHEVLRNYSAMGEEFDMFTLTQPTSPLCAPEDHIEAYRMYNERNADAVVSFCPAENTPNNFNTLPDDGRVNRFLSIEDERPRQCFAPYYRMNGAIYMVNRRFFPADGYIYGDDAMTYAYIMPRHRSYDIDEKIDFVIAEAILKNFGMI